MRRKFTSSTSWSRARSMTEDEDIELALRRLRDKLKAFQPLYTEEDVAVIPFSTEGGSPSHSPLPPEERGDDFLLGSSTMAENDNESRRQSNAPSLSSTQGAGDLGGAPTSSSINLDTTISATLYLTAVNILDPKMILKSRPVAMNAIKLIKHGYALVWHDPKYILDGATATVTGGGGPFGSKQPLRARSVTDQGQDEDRPTMLPERRRSASPVRPGAAVSMDASRALFRPVSPTPVHQPSSGAVARLDECVQSLLVYANSSQVLRHFITSQQPTLQLMCFICNAARRLEAGQAANDTSVEGERCVDAELETLNTLWHSCGVAGRLADYLRECYLTEFLLDAALPPAVCSFRYDGLMNALLDKKQKIIADIAASRQGFTEMMRMVPLRGLAALTTMSAYAEVKLRVRLLDKMAAEGLVERISAEVVRAIADLREGVPDPRSRVRGSDSLVAARAQCGDAGSDEVDGRQSQGKGFKYLSECKKGTPRRNSSGRTSPSPRASKSDAVSLPARGSTNHSSRRNTTSEVSPVDRLGYCVDILLLLTTPNLRHPAEAEELQRNPKTAPSAVVRASVWATQEAALQEITSHFLLLACVPELISARPYVLASLQAQAMDCVLQLAVYSGKLFAMVVRTVDAALSGSLLTRYGLDAAAKARNESRDASLTPTRHSISAAAGNSGSGGVLHQHYAKGLLPLMANLLSHTTHAQANARSIHKWFSALSRCLLPQAFEAPQLTNGRKSDPSWGRQQKKKGLVAASKGGKTAASAERLEAPVLARDLQRAEVNNLSPYFCFASRIARDTTWRDGAEPFFAKMALLAYHVVLTHARRCNLCFGQASACYDLIAPMLRPVSGVLPGGTVEEDDDLEEREEEATNSDEAEQEEEEQEGSETPTRVTRRRSTGGMPTCPVGAAGRKRSRSQGGDDSLQTFIPSPSRAPIFYEAYSPSSEDSASPDSPASPVGRRNQTLLPPLTPERAGEEGDESPQPVTRTWRERLSLRMLLSSLTKTYSDSS